MIEQWLDVVCREAGWKKPYQNKNGKYRLRLLSNINVDVSSPNDRELVLESNIVKVPASSGEPILEKAAKAVLPRVFKDTGVVSLDVETNTLVLQKNVILGALRHSQFSYVMESFLNDLHFYKSIYPNML